MRSWLQPFEQEYGNSIVRHAAYGMRTIILCTSSQSVQKHILSRYAAKFSPKCSIYAFILPAYRVLPRLRSIYP